MMNILKKMAKYLIIAIFFVSIDRFLKILALTSFEFSKKELILDIFGFSLAKNYYIAFSLPLSGPILTSAIILLILFIVYFWLTLIKKAEYTEAGYLTFILFGAISNVIDRLKYGYVVDYFDLKYFTVFNVADMMIVGGVFALLIYSIKNKNV